MLPDATRYLAALEDTAQFLRKRFGEAPSMGLVLGSGLGDFVADLEQVESISYREIPHFPVARVAGHAGQLSLLLHRGRRCCVLRGRVHLYEGLSAWEVVYAVRAVGLWGVPLFAITNAAGAINPQLQPGDLMLITDHINLQGENPLQGPNLDRLGERFPDMSEAYSRSLRTLARQCAAQLGQSLKEGIYLALRGPSYETPAEIQMCARLGADAVGMSTVPEVLALNHMRKQVVGLSCITNMAAGIGSRKLAHHEVLEVTQQVRGRFAALLLKLMESIESHG